MVPIDLLPEQELLLCCARTRLEPRHHERATAILRGQVDWDRLLLTADHHKLTGLLARHLTGACAEPVPPGVRDRLAASGAKIARRNLVLAGELCRLLNLFKSQGMTAVPYKGPVLALQAYGHLGLRQSVDLDIFVRREEVLPAKRILMAEGYRPNVDLSSAQQATVLRSEYAIEMFHREKRVALELHWDIGRRYFSFPLEAVSLWDRLEAVSIGGSAIPSPSWEDHLLLVCAHSSKHCWDRLMWIVDVAELLRNHPVSGLARVLERAHELGAMRMVQLGLLLAHRLLEANVPEEVVRRIEEDRAVTLLVDGVSARLFTDKPKVASLLDQVRFHLSVRERLRDRLRYCVHGMVTPTLLDATWLPLPGILSPVYLVARPARLLGRHLFRIPKNGA